MFFFLSYYLQDPPLADKAKKSWSQRLKLAKSDKSPTNHHIPESSHLSSPSALSRSMKYAEPWLYGTVRGMPNANASNYDYVQPHFTLMPELAVVLCSCREYLTGTKRDIKKPAICKKCKGTRLPITPVGGTVRIHSSQCIVQTNNRNSVGTVRLPSTFSAAASKQRPSILTADNDPYDVMRRSRLMSPDLKSVKPAKNRAKSSSPTRNKDRYLKQQNAMATATANGGIAGGVVGNGGGGGTVAGRGVGNGGAAVVVKSDSNRSRSATRTIDIESNWTESMDSNGVAADASSARRSILQCSVNPYELISKTLHNNEFAPLEEDDVYDMHSQKYENLLNSLHGHRFANSANKTNTLGRHKPMQSTKTPVQSVYAPDNNAYEKYNFTPTNTSTYKSSKELKASNGQALHTPITNGRPEPPLTSPRNHTTIAQTHDNKTNKIESAVTSPTQKSECRTLVLTVDPSPTVNTISVDTGSSTIKSILKRPTVAIAQASTATAAAAAAATATHNPNYRNGNGIAAAHNGTLSKSSSVVRRAAPKKAPTSFATPIVDPASSAGATANRNTKNSIQTPAGTINNDTPVTSAARISDDGSNTNNNGRSSSMKVKQNSGPNFYLPLPQRKKVQFLVEHEVIIDESRAECSENDDMCVNNDSETDARSTADTKVNGGVGLTLPNGKPNVMVKPKAIADKIAMYGQHAAVQQQQQQQHKGTNATRVTNKKSAINGIAEHGSSSADKSGELSRQIRINSIFLLLEFYRRSAPECN